MPPFKRRKTGKRIVYIQYPCYICATFTSSIALTTVAHLESANDITLAPRTKGARRPPSDRYSFEKNPNRRYDSHHYGYPSCWYHCGESIPKLEQHIKNYHQRAAALQEVQDVVEVQYEAALNNGVENVLPRQEGSFEIIEGIEEERLGDMIVQEVEEEELPTNNEENAPALPPITTTIDRECIRLLLQRITQQVQELNQIYEEYVGPPKSL